MIQFTGKIHEGDRITHHFPPIDEMHKYLAQQGFTLHEPTILINLFPPFYQELVVANPPPPQEGNVEISQNGSYTSSEFVYLCDKYTRL